MLTELQRLRRAVQLSTQCIVSFESKPMDLLYVLLYNGPRTSPKPHKCMVCVDAETPLPKPEVAGSRPVSRLASFSVKKPLSANAEVTTNPGQIRPAKIPRYWGLKASFVFKRL